MAKDDADDINSYFLLIDANQKDDLADIRHWNNLKIAFEENKIWIKDLSYAQIHSKEVKSIPFVTVYYEKNGKLFLLNSLLPDRTVPALLWTPIDRALPVKLPELNHNYFGISEKISVSLIPSEKEAEAVAMITTTDILQQNIETAPTVRLQKIQWVILDVDKVFLIGTPILPITGEVFWQRNDFLIPAGYDLDLFSLTDVINKIINPEQNNWVVWNKDSTYFLVDKNELQNLTLGSFRLSMQQFSLPDFFSED